MVFAEISVADQWLLHNFFRPDKNWSNLELLQHREAITKERPSLPHQAGRALERFWEASAHYATARVRAANMPAGSRKQVKQKDRHISVKAVVQPEIDVEALARALIREVLDKARVEPEAGSDNDAGQEPPTEAKG